MKLHQKLFLLLVFLLPVQLGRHFWPNWSYVMGLRVDYLTPTIYLTDLLVLAILGAWILEKTKNLKLLFFVSLTFIFLLANSLLAQNSGAALYKFFKILEFSLLGFYIAKNKIELSIIHFPLSIAVVYSSLIAIAQFIRQSSLNGVFWFLGERTFNAGTPGIARTVINGRLLMRPYATFPHPNALAGFILVSLILTFPYLLKKNRLFSMFYALCSTSALVLTFSRSAWLVGALVLFYLFFSKIKTKFLSPLVITFGEEAFAQRTELNKIAIQLIKSHPLSGVGLNNFIVYLPEFWRSTGQTYWLQPVHNIYLLILAETGITGLLIFLFLIIKAFKNLLKIKNWKLEIALLAILLTGMVDHYWLTLQQNQLLLAIVLGLCWSKARVLK